MSNTLLPCPFCGGTPILDLFNDGFFDYARIRCCRVMFDWCGDETGEQAIAAWNRRAGDDTNVATNADRIRSMSDEELAKELTRNPPIPCRVCEYYNHKHANCGAPNGFVCVTEYAEALILDWLKQPVKEE